MTIFFRLLSVVFIFNLSIINAQNVGIGTTAPDSSAALHISSTNKGLLIPRIALQNNTDVTTIASPAAGIVVYNTANAGTGSQAVFANNFYFWNGVKWIDMVTIDSVREILRPHVFVALQNDTQQLAGYTRTSPTSTLTSKFSPNVNDNDLVVQFGTSIVNSDINSTGTKLITLSNNTFKNNAPNPPAYITNPIPANLNRFEISGFVTVNPYVDANKMPADIEFVIQKQNGASWIDLAKTTGVWGVGTHGNSRTMSIAPIVVRLLKDDVLRAIVRSNTDNLGTYFANDAVTTSTTHASIQQPILSIPKRLKFNY